MSSLAALAGLRVLSGVGMVAAACWRWMQGVLLLALGLSSTRMRGSRKRFWRSRVFGQAGVSRSYRELQARWSTRIRRNVLFLTKMPHSGRAGLGWLGVDGPLLLVRLLAHRATD